MFQANVPAAAPGKAKDVMPLGAVRRGFSGVIVAVGRKVPESGADARPSEFDLELERRLLEIGFVEGATVEILHEGFIGKDPIAVRVDDMKVALRRREANAIMVRPRARGDEASRTND